MSYQQQAYTHVKQRIMSLYYKPNQVLSDREIAEELNMSRTPVRDAFTRLECEGLLVNDPDKRGWRVYTLTLDDIREIFEIKKALEGMIVQQAAGSTDAQLRAQLTQALDQMRAATERKDDEDWLAADFALHAALAKMANNARTYQIVLNLNAQWHRIRVRFTATHVRMSDAAYREHAAFVGAVLAGEGDEARRHLTTHMERVQAELVDLLTNLVIPFAQNGI